MGGFGSGRSSYATTPTVEECRHLEANKFTDALDRHDTTATLRWGDPDDPAATVAAKIGPAGEDGHPSHLRLKYTATPPNGDPVDVDERVPLAYTEPHFGGVRPWFRCPSCDERRGKLYLPPRRRRFRCRECYDLGYRSSRTSGDEMERAEQRYRKAFAKADAEDRRPHPNNAPYLPDRPKGMHHDTFAELAADVRAAREEWDDAMQARLREMTDRAGALLD